MNAPIPFRLHVMLAAQRARADGFHHFAAELAAMLRAQKPTERAPAHKTRHKGNMTETEQTTTTASKPAVIEALRAFVAQRSGIDFRDYQSGDWKASRAAFMGDYRPILKYGRHARQLLRAVELRDSITAEDLIAASARAFSGRLTIKVREDGAVAIDYCTGQYFPTEYRNAVCAVLAEALWDYFRRNMPAPTKSKDGARDLYNGLSAGDWLRRKARDEFGLSIARAWFS